MKMTTHALFYALHASPLGDLLLLSDAETLTALYTPLHPAYEAGRGRLTEAKALTEARRQLDAYFDGKRTYFDLPLRHQGTDFQRKLWSALSGIPYGKTTSYQALAARAGYPQGARAAGRAVGSNPFSIFLPCHRVVGANGAMRGYAGGIEAKRWLLAHEAVHSVKAELSKVAGT
jgi:methylated-DNA-[protein]-cysteine S-methyltransferase